MGYLTGTTYFSGINESCVIFQVNIIYLVINFIQTSPTVFARFSNRHPNSQRFIFCNVYETVVIEINGFHLIIFIKKLVVNCARRPLCTKESKITFRSIQIRLTLSLSVVVRLCEVASMILVGIPILTKIPWVMQQFFVTDYEVPSSIFRSNKGVSEFFSDVSVLIWTVFWS